MSPTDDDVLDPALHAVTDRAANEGVPVGAVSRIIQRPFSLVYDYLKTSITNGRVGSMPKPDWPPSQHWNARLPTVPRTANSNDVEFAVRQTFKLTPLEAAFLLVLLRYESVDKDKLHGVVENQRLSRQLRPDHQECTDVKMVDVIICKLRAKLKLAAFPSAITTVWGKGYFISPPVKEAVYNLIGAPHAFTTDDERESVAAASA